MRRLAKERNVSVLEFNKLIGGDRAVDELIDGEMKRYAAEHGNGDVIFDSRLAWHFVPKSFKVFLAVSPKEAAERVFSNRILEEEKYATKETALYELLERRNEEIKRFKDFYGVDCDDYGNYDVIVDTSELATHEISDIILRVYEYNIEKRPHAKLYLSPKNISIAKNVKKEGEITVRKDGHGFALVEGSAALEEAIKEGKRIVEAAT
jgi:cytidylate kinase